MEDRKPQSGVEVSGESQSRILSFKDGFAWLDRVRTVYKEDGTQNWRGVSRTSLVGGSDAIATPFQLRYFEVEPGGFSSREKHEHEHVVVIVRGRGHVELGERKQSVSFGDVIHVAPWDVHQFCNREGSEPFGFLCVVPAERDRPVPVPGDQS